MWVGVATDGQIVKAQNITESESMAGDVQLLIFEDEYHHEPDDALQFMRSEAIDLVRGLLDALDLPPLPVMR